MRAMGYSGSKFSSLPLSFSYTNGAFDMIDINGLSLLGDQNFPLLLQ